MITRKPGDTTPPAADSTTSKSPPPPATHPAASVPARESASDADVAEFIAKMKAVAPATTGDRGRLVFAMDATMSRAPTWDLALSLQGEMFAAVKSKAVKVHIGQTYKLADAAQAHQDLEARRTVGSTVLLP